MSRRPLIIAILTAAVLAAFLAREASLGGTGTARAVFLDVGQGDGILLVSPTGKQVVIDGGPDRTMLSRLGSVMPFFDRTIELLILTHPDADHVSSMPDILKKYRVERILLTGVRHDSGIYARFLESVKAEGAQVLFADPALDIDMGDGLYLDVVWPPPGLAGTLPKASNETSIVLRAFAGSTSLLLTGDIEAGAEAGILASAADIDVDILKVAHHGSRTSSMTGFLLAASPELAIISVGRNNKFGHPHPWVTRRFQTLSIPFRTTAEEGTITIPLK